MSTDQKEPQALLIQHIAGLLHLDPDTIVITQDDDVVTITLTQESLGPMAAEGLSSCKYVFAQDDRFDDVVGNNFELIEERVAINENQISIVLVNANPEDTIHALNTTFDEIPGAQRDFILSSLIGRAFHHALEQVLGVEPEVEFETEGIISGNARDGTLVKGPRLRINNKKAERAGMSDFLDAFLDNAGIPRSIFYSCSHGSDHSLNGFFGYFAFQPELVDTLYQTIVVNFVQFTEGLNAFWQEEYLPRLREGIIEGIWSTIQRVHVEAELPDITTIGTLLLPASSNIEEEGGRTTVTTPLLSTATTEDEALVIKTSQGSVPLADVVRSVVKDLGYDLTTEGRMGQKDYTDPEQRVEPFGTWETLARLRSGLQVGMEWYSWCFDVDDTRSRVEKNMRNRRESVTRSHPRIGPGSADDNPRIGPDSDSDTPSAGK